MTLEEMHINRSLMLMDCLGPEIFWMEGQVLHRESVHLKVSGWLSGFSAHLTRKLPVLVAFERCRSENIWLVSGSFFKLLRMMFLTVKLCVWLVKLQKILV